MITENKCKRCIVSRWNEGLLLFLPLPRLSSWHSYLPWSPHGRPCLRRRRARSWTAGTSSSAWAAAWSALPFPSASRARTLMILPSTMLLWSLSLARSVSWVRAIVMNPPLGLCRCRWSPCFGSGRPCCWRGAAWAWPRRRAGTWPRVSSSVLQGGEVEEVAGLRDRAAAGTCSRRIQITKVIFTHGHDQSCFQSLLSNCHE